MRAIFKLTKGLKACKPHNLPEGAYVEVIAQDGGTYLVEDINTHEVVSVSKEKFNSNTERIH